MELLVTEIVIPVIAIILTALAVAVARKIQQKIGLEIEEKVIENAVLRVEEYAREYVKTNGKKIPSHEKLDMAVLFIWDALPETKKDEYRDILEGKINAMVAKLFHLDEPA